MVTESSSYQTTSREENIKSQFHGTKKMSNTKPKKNVVFYPQVQHKGDSGSSSSQGNGKNIFRTSVGSLFNRRIYEVH